MKHDGKRIAVIGAGIAGMSAAYLLSRKYETHLFEKESRLGGHTHTHYIETAHGSVAVDSGFIVHNDRTYPNLVRLFEELGVATQPSDMSFGVSCRDTGFQYSSRGLNGFFAQRTNLLSPRHYLLFGDLMRFNKQGARCLTDPATLEMTLGQFLDQNRFSRTFQDLYLYPMASAVWSTSVEEMREFPAATLLTFFNNHGFLGLNTHPKWKTVVGGSSSYIGSLTQPYKDQIHLDADISSVTRSVDGVIIRMRDNSTCIFDEVVFACHGNQVLPMLKDASIAEANILGSFSTSANHTVLHTDAGMLPEKKAARASWNYQLASVGKATHKTSVTYDMNRLQSLTTHDQFCVSLNPNGHLDRTLVLREMRYQHPIYDFASVRAQSRWKEISGVNNTHFCGAYWFYGFHEDGFNSALRVASALGVEW